MAVNTKCPVNPEHGPVIPVKDPTSPWGWYCPHAEHDGRLHAHPLGDAPSTRALFTTDEVAAGRLAEGSNDNG